jgi:hypothetical protein
MISQDAIEVERFRLLDAVFTLLVELYVGIA